MKNALLLSLLLVAGAACAQEQLAVGAQAPRFSLVNAIDGKTVAMKPDDGQLKVVFFTCNQCPFAKAFEPRLIEIAQQFQQKGVRFYAIDSNDDMAYPEETLANMKSRATAKSYPYPYLKDADSAIARAYGARVTPHVYVVDGTGVVRYRGYVDDSARPEERKTTGLTNALTAILDGREVATPVTREFGCSIKYKSGRP
ncbi:MAG: thioredoxin family protein [Acidobacteria bacterium]|nr:thioredoxin family protein [Acidobacteriota bacterium]MBV9477456.1 thioredoxin family protein [Acidobacteriota bacterium]